MSMYATRPVTPAFFPSVPDIIKRDRPVGAGFGRRDRGVTDRAECAGLVGCAANEISPVLGPSELRLRDMAKMLAGRAFVPFDARGSCPWYH